MSAAARKRLSEMMKKRWADRKKKSSSRAANARTILAGCLNPTAAYEGQRLIMIVSRRLILRQRGINPSKCCSAMGSADGGNRRSSLSGRRSPSNPLLTGNAPASGDSLADLSSDWPCGGSCLVNRVRLKAE